VKRDTKKTTDSDDDHCFYDVTKDPGRAVEANAFRVEE